MSDRIRFPLLVLVVAACVTARASVALGSVDRSHVGLYLGGERFIHAPHAGARVSVDALSGWYAGTYDGARRVL